MKPVFKISLADIGIGAVALLTGAGIIYLGDTLLGVRLEYYFGVGTFDLAWVADLFLVPFVAGFVVALIYGLGGKILAHFAPLLVRGYSYLALEHGGIVPPEGVIVLPVAYWILIVVVAAEFAAFGGVVGEIVIKKTYGRSPKEKLHKRYQKAKTASSSLGNDGSKKQRVGEVEK